MFSVRLPTSKCLGELFLSSWVSCKYQLVLLSGKKAEQCMALVNPMF